MIRHEADGLRWYTFANIPFEEVNYGIFTRLGGVSKGIHSSLNLSRTCGDALPNVWTNLDRVYKQLGRSLESRYNIWQVHGTTIHFPDAAKPPDIEPQPGDAMFTDNPEVTLAMVFADCLPLLFYNRKKKAIGIVHSGWQGTWQKIAKLAVEQASDRYKCRPEDWSVGIGPGICGNCYQVREDVRSKFLASWGDEAEKYFKPDGDRFLLDLPGAVEDTLIRAGVLDIENSHVCTAEGLDEWYSYRKEKGATGRFGVTMALRSDQK